MTIERPLLLIVARDIRSKGIAPREVHDQYKQFRHESNWNLGENNKSYFLV